MDTALELQRLVIADYQRRAERGWRSFLVVFVLRGGVAKNANFLRKMAVCIGLYSEIMRRLVSGGGKIIHWLL